MKSLTLGLFIALCASACTVHTGRHSSHDDDRYRGSSGTAADQVLVCHKGKKTLSLPPSAVDAHLGHGDRRGAC
jgi:hypothetical protein